MAKKGEKLSDETRAKMSATRRGVPKILSDAHRANIVAANKRRVATPDGRARLMQTLSFRGRHHTVETRANIKARLLGKPRPAETRAKIAASTKGRVLSPDHRARIAAAVCASWAKRKSVEGNR